MTRTTESENLPPGFRSGFVAIAGRPNVGKSTLLNALVGEEVAIATRRPQTTRRRIRGIVNRGNSQIVFVDTPGIHLWKSTTAEPWLNKYMLAEARSALSEVDLTVLLVEARRRGGSLEPDAEDRLALEAVRQAGRECLLCINKIDLLKQKEKLLPLMEAYLHTKLFSELIPISALKNDGLDRLLESIESRLPEGPRYFPIDMPTDQPERLLAAEYIRRQVLLQTNQEVPYHAAVEVIAFEEEAGESGRIQLHAVIFVERDSQKGILIGKGGRKLKAIGAAAREAIGRLLGRRVHLDLRVKVKKGWSRTPAGLRSVGYEDG
jgi:GTP-binding protein Era